MNAADGNFNIIENNLFFRVLSKYISPDDLKMLKIKACWLKNPGRPLSDCTFPFKLDSQNGILEIVCYPQAYAQEILNFKKEILSNLNQDIKDLGLKDIRVSVDRLRTEKLKEQSLAQGSSVTVISADTSQKDSRESREAAAAVVQAGSGSQKGSPENREAAAKNAAESAQEAPQKDSPESKDAVTEGIARLSEISRRICEREFSQGAQKCRKCSFPAKRGGDLCSLCQWEEREAVDNTVIRYLNRNIYEYRPDSKKTVRDLINAELAAKGLPEIDLERYNRIKKKILSQNKNDIWKYIYSQPEGSPIDENLSARLVELACLISEKTPPEIDERILLKALGPSLAAIYNSKTVFHIRRSKVPESSTPHPAPPN